MARKHSIAEEILISAYVGEDRKFNYKQPSDFVLTMHGGDVYHYNNVMNTNLWIFPDGSGLRVNPRYIEGSFTLRS
jgi:hypothetical protein